MVLPHSNREIRLQTIDSGKPDSDPTHLLIPNGATITGQAPARRTPRSWRRAHRAACATLTLLALAAPAVGAPPLPEEARPYAEAAERIIAEARKDDAAWQRLARLCDDIGHRLTGSENLDRAIAWAKAELEKDGQENVRGHAVEVPIWVRGTESLTLLHPRRESLPMLGLGYSPSTPKGGIEAEVLVVVDEADLERNTQRAKGRIVLFNEPMRPYDPTCGAYYGEAVRFRIDGSVMAAAHGARAVLVRSVTNHSLRTPHAGTQGYHDVLPPIPAAAISTEDADRLARLQARGKTPRVRLEMQAENRRPGRSENVIAELVGREKPDEIVVISGHLDSWDVGQGAHDDGGGVVMAMESLRILRALGLRPRRTIRVVLWTNEEYGASGGQAYAKDHAAELPKHVAAIEADNGAFDPKGYAFQHADPAAERRGLERLTALLSLLRSVGSDHARAGFSGVDIYPMSEAGVPLLGHLTDMERFFEIHHTAADTIDKVDPRELADNVATMAVTAYVLAEMPERLDAPAPPSAP